LIKSWRVSADILENDFDAEELKFASKVAENRRILSRCGCTVECVQSERTIGELKATEDFQVQFDAVFNGDAEP
jgi:hypothetical protein